MRGAAGFLPTRRASQRNPLKIPEGQLLSSMPGGLCAISLKSPSVSAFLSFKVWHCIHQPLTRMSVPTCVLDVCVGVQEDGGVGRQRPSGMTVE